MNKRISKIIGFVVLLSLCLIMYFWGLNSKERYTTTDFDIQRTDEGEFYIEGIWDLVEEKSCRYVVIKPVYTTDYFANMKITAIGESAFANVTVMETVYIPSSIKKIDVNAFLGCSNLTQVNYQGTEKEWKELNIESGNDVLNNATINFNVAVPNID